MKKILFMVLASTSLLASCSTNLKPFTQRLYDETGWSDNDLKRIQFYLSEDVVLIRDESSQTRSRIRNGEIEIEDGGAVEKVIIRKGTPGVFVFSPKANRLAISFDKDDEKFLMFGPNPKANNRYLILASEWKKSSGKVTYNGRRYRIDDSDAYATLMVDLKKVRQMKVQSSTASGRRID